MDQKENKEHKEHKEKIVTKIMKKPSLPQHFIHRAIEQKNIEKQTEQMEQTEYLIHQWKETFQKMKQKEERKKNIIAEIFPDEENDEKNYSHNKNNSSIEDKTLEDKDKTLEDNDKTLEDKIVSEKTKTIFKQTKKTAEDKITLEKTKILFKQAKKTPEDKIVLKQIEEIHSQETDLKEEKANHSITSLFATIAPDNEEENHRLSDASVFNNDTFFCEYEEELSFSDETMVAEPIMATAIDVTQNEVSLNGVHLQANDETLIKKVPLQDNHDNIIQKKVPLQDNDDDTIQKKVPLQDEYDADMTLLWEEKIEVNVNIETPELISPLTGKILLLDKDKILIGRANDTDMMLIDDYISRYHLELRKTPLGYTLKNIGTNDILIEKQIIKQQTNIQLEQKILANNNTTVLSKETTIYIGDHILYYIPKNTQQPQTPASQRIQTQKYHFYQGLAEQKRELLEAAQMQKYLTPSRAIFDNLGIGMWFQYMAINDLSGDFFLYHKEEDSIYFCLGDVSGHGSAAALLANQISGMFRILAQQQQTTEDIIKILNQNIYNAKRKTHNLYALINALKVTQNRIDFSIAGNAVPPLYYNAEENKVISLDTPSTPAGLLTSEHFKIYTDHIDFKENDLLILFTDGVTEAQMHDKSLLEYERTQEQLTKQIQEYTILENFLENFLIWLKKNSEIKDDLSIVLIGKLPTT